MGKIKFLYDCGMESTVDHRLWAPTPPMGWNSWDCFGASVREDEVLANAEYMAKNLKRFGWDHIVVDIQWYEPTADSSVYHHFAPLEMDEYSRLIPSVNRFPSAAGSAGFKPLADKVHGMGLKFGIHIMRGIPRQAAHRDTPILGTDVGARGVAHPNSICPWNTDMYGLDPRKPESQLYYDSIFALYAEWGVDYVKVDDIAASRLYGTHRGEMEMIHRAILKSGRPMVLSLSPGPAPLDHAGDFVANANLWRLTDDFWDRWEPLLDMFDRCEKWAPYVGDGCWPDCDMLPLGHIGIRSVDGGGGDRRTRFTEAEQRTLMTLWCVFRAPLMFGGHLPDNDEATLALITNPEVLAVHRDGRGARPAYRRGDELVWTAKDEKGTDFVAVFNTGDRAISVLARLDDIALKGSKTARDLWERSDLGAVEDAISVALPAHGAALLSLRGIEALG